MRNNIIALCFCIGIIGCSNPAEGQDIDEVSYALGVVLGQNIKSQNMDDLDLSSLYKGLEDMIKGNETKIEPAQCMNILNEYMAAKQSQQFEGNKKKGEDFLIENGKRPEVITTASGLQYEVIKEGSGPKPTLNDRVKVHYHGTLLDGTVFDSSVDKGVPMTNNVSIFIDGWKEGLTLMSVGSKYKMYIPYDIAYGAQGSPGAIEPFSTIIFDVELLGIE